MEIDGVGSGINLRVGAPPKYYRYGVHDADSGVMVGIGGPRQGFMVQLSGDWWAGGIPSGEMLQGWLELGLKPTRFDYSATALVAADVESAAELIAVAAQAARNVQDKKEPIWHKPYCKPHLQTWYAGNRTSDHFLRVYDKLVGFDEDMKYIRIEMEYKGEMAPRALQGFIEHGTGDVRGILKWMHAGDEGPYIPDLQRLWLQGGEAPKAGRVPPPPSNRIAWFYGNAEKAFKNWAAENSDAAQTWLEIMRQRYIEGQK
jgi:hypothetical protein